mmetsp:Transcript_9572/g.14145  ORF Transcript_9572/g.14145 Transcript_9572/m.14145 type:complete len:204 (-) Transcript_9572:51-662(-)
MSLAGYENITYAGTEQRSLTPAKKGGLPRYNRAELKKKGAKTTSFRVNKQAVLRDSLTPGTVVIILIGQYAGNRVVFLKQLEKSQQLLVTGASFNETPLVRIDQRFVIATRTKVDISSVNIPAEINDELLNTIKQKRTTLEGGNSKYAVDQAAVDARESKINALSEKVAAAVKPLVAKVDLLGDYLAEKFTLRDGDYPHQLQF